jgi:hypothetical protein
VIIAWTRFLKIIPKKRPNWYFTTDNFHKKICKKNSQILFHSRQHWWEKSKHNEQRALFEWKTNKTTKKKRWKKLCWFSNTSLDWFSFELNRKASGCRYVYFSFLVCIHTKSDIVCFWFDLLQVLTTLIQCIFFGLNFWWCFESNVWKIGKTNKKSR